MQKELFEYLCSFLTAERLSGFERVLDLRTRHITVALEDLYDPHNASAVLRSCDCFGVQDLHVIESRNDFSPNTDISLGAGKWTTVIRHRDEHPAVTSIQHLRNMGYRIVATAPESNLGSIRDLDISTPVALFFGNEKEGVTQTVRDTADTEVQIPMQGFTDSFNISVAVAITLYELSSRLRSDRTDWGLSEPEKQSLREEWVQKSLGSKLEPYLKRFRQDHGLA